MEHLSLHSYLESCFLDTEIVTDQMIIDAKKQYRSKYLSTYYKTYGEKHRQISFRVSKKQCRVLEEKARATNLKLGAYVKALVLTNKKVQDSSNVQYLLLVVIDIIEEAIQEEEPINTKNLLSLLEQMQKLLS